MFIGIPCQLSIKWKMLKLRTTSLFLDVSLKIFLGYKQSKKRKNYPWCYRATVQTECSSILIFLSFRLLYKGFENNAHTVWKRSVFGVALVLIQSKCRKMRIKITPNTDTFYTERSFLETKLVWRLFNFFLC